MPARYERVPRIHKKKCPCTKRCGRDLGNAGVKRCYGIVGDTLNPVIDALRRNGKIEFIHVRHEEYGVFAAVAEAYLTGAPLRYAEPPGPA
jgi:pyruvate dehydrogenase (quinone)